MTSAKTSNILKVKDKEHLVLMRAVISGEKTQIRAGFELGICPRQVRRIAAKMQVFGDFGVVHGSFGKVSKNQLDASVLRAAKDFLLEPLHLASPPFGSD